MRKVDYHSITPQPMQDSRANEARQIVSEFLDQPEEMRLSRRAPINREMFTSLEVREALKKLFLGKCGYCEIDLSGKMYVDHYRPIANAGAGKKKLPHHYAWLAYDWENLVHSCATCNRRKANFFGLMAGKRAPLKAPLGQIRAQETPKLLDPGFDAPFKHLDFTLDGHVHARTRRGEATIATLELNRSELLTKRKNAFEFLEGQLKHGDKKDAVMLLHRISEPITPFSGAQQIIRYHYLSALAVQVGKFALRFDDAAGLIDNLIERASSSEMAIALDKLREPKQGTRTTKAERAPRAFTPPITQILIKNFKSIDQIKIELSPSSQEYKTATALMLLGENATGKSSILQAVTLALVGATTANKIADAKQFIPSITRGGHVGSQGNPKVIIEFAEGPPAVLEIKNGHFVGDATPRANVMAYSSNRYFKPGKRRSRIGARGLLDPTWGLPNPETWLNKLGPDQFRNVARALAEIMALPRNAYLKREPVIGTVIVDGDLTTPIAEHSDGYRSIFATAVDMLDGLRSGIDLLEAEGVVLIDEIETHLHPRWKMRLMAAMRAALPRVQFIVTTHDPLCLRGMGHGEVHVMARDKNNHIVLIPDLPDISGMRIDQILTSEHFGLQSTLDPSLEGTFTEYHSLLRQQSSDAETLERIQTLRTQINEKQEIGKTERERRLLDAIDRHLANQSSESGARAFQERELDAELDAIWSAAEAETK